MISLEEIQAKLAVPSTVAGNSDCVAGELGLPQRLSRQLEFIAEVDKIKHILRRNLLTDGSRRENDAEHSWHLAMMAILLEEYASEAVDLKRVLSMVIVHDLVEIYAGDTFAYDVEGNKDKELREEQAAKKLFSLLPEDQGRYI